MGIPMSSLPNCYKNVGKIFWDSHVFFGGWASNFFNSPISWIGVQIIRYEQKTIDFP